MTVRTTSAPSQKGDGATRPRASERMREAETMHLNLPVIGHVRMPRADHLAYYGGLAALSAFQLIEWPIALVLGVGHVLANNHQNRISQGLGEALEDA